MALSKRAPEVVRERIKAEIASGLSNCPVSEHEFFQLGVVEAHIRITALCLCRKCGLLLTISM